jgi:hypothetical protein
MPFITLGGKNMLYMHVPKNGGTTVENWLASLGPLHFSCNYNLGYSHTFRSTPQHFTADDIQRLFANGFFSYSFLFTRNPYDRIESEYRYLHKIDHLKRSLKNLFSIPTFDEWIKESLQEIEVNPWIWDNHLRPQWEYIYPSIDVYKVEDGLLNGIKSVAFKMGVTPPTELPHLNHTRDINVATRWSDESRALVQKYYARDFKEFGYTP